jgi:AAHS family 4-hydroxybenzoate transporter-like MFS transporter
VGSLGQDPSVIIAATVLTSVGGIVAATIIGPSMDRINPFLILGSVYILGSVFVTILGRSLDGEAWVLLVAAFLAGTCVTGGQMSIVAVASLVYPARLRSTGVGWALGIGRLGGIIGPILVGSALGGGVAPATVFLVISVLLIAASASIFMLGTIARSRAAAN